MSTDAFDQLEKYLEECGISIAEFNETRARNFRLVSGMWVQVATIGKTLRQGRAYKFPLVFDYLENDQKLFTFLTGYCKEKNLLPTKVVLANVEKEIVKLQDLILYKDVSPSMDREPRYFTGSKEGLMSSVPGHHYIAVMGIKQPELESLPVVPEYSPKGPKGIYPKETDFGDVMNHMNCYIPPAWRDFDGELPDKLPTLFKKLVDHLFPTQEAKDFFFHWTYCSLVGRAETYLMLQGAPAIGKNRLKIHLRALHGHSNSIDAKKSTLTTNFNSQLREATLVYFDEIRYTEEEENIMKEIPNGTISIEAKGVDATRSTKIYCSMVLAGNKPRDHFIAFDARKFCPIELTKRPLSDSMTDEEINEMSEKVEFSDHENYDLAYTAQIGRWILKNGKRNKWKNCEYRSPKFWYLANVSMPIWQKKLLQFIFDPPETAEKFHLIKRFKYSELMANYEKKVLKKDKIRAHVISVDYSNARYFFDIYGDLKGNKIFKTKTIPKNIMGDFYIEIVETPVLGETDHGEEETEERVEDLL